MIERLSEVTGRGVSRETLEKLTAFEVLLQRENERQNLISKQSAEAIWERHLLDAAQLLRFAPAEAKWCDIGSGAGLPGIVLAILGVGLIVLVEPRRLRADFLDRTIVALDLKTASVTAAKIEQVQGSFDVVTARAVASTTRLFAIAEHVTHPGTVWLLPKGRSAQSELDEAGASWQGDFRLEPSLTSGEASILIATDVRGRGTS